MKFDPNLGSFDRGLRIIAGLLLFVIGLLTMLGLWSPVAVLIGGFLLLTTVFTFCPIYALLSLNTAEAE